MLRRRVWSAASKLLPAESNVGNKLSSSNSCKRFATSTASLPIATNRLFHNRNRIVTNFRSRGYSSSTCKLVVYATPKPDPLDGIDISNQEPEAPDPATLIPIFDQFYVSNSDHGSVHDYPEGAYVDINSEDLDKYMPEGFAGDADEDFQFMKRRAWMIRDTSKILFQLIEEHEARFLGNPSPGLKMTQSFQTPINLPGFTDRPEWEAAQLRVYRHGKLLPQPSKFTEGGLKALKGPGSVAYQAMMNLNTDVETLPNKILLQGDRGSGKSYLLNQAVLYARQRGWVCLFVPNGWDHVQSGYYVEPCIHQKKESNEQQGAATRPLFDNPIMSVKLLRDFWQAHGGLMATLPIKNPLLMSKYGSYIQRATETAVRVSGVKGRGELTFIDIRKLIEGDDNMPEEDELDESILEGYKIIGKEYTTLEDLILLGVAFRDLSGSLFMDLVEELKSIESHLVLFAVDQMNSWDTKSAFSYEYKPVAGRDLCVPRALSFMSQRKSETDSWVLKSGLCIGALSFKHPEGRAHRIKYDNWRASLPMSINVPVYNQVEFLSHMAYYNHMKLISRPADVSSLASFRTFAASVPGTMRSQVLDFYLMKELELAFLQNPDDDRSREAMIAHVQKELRAKFEEHSPLDDEWMDDENQSVEVLDGIKADDFELNDEFQSWTPIPGSGDGAERSEQEIVAAELEEFRMEKEAMDAAALKMRGGKGMPNKKKGLGIKRK